MTHPDIVQSALGDEGVAARVGLGDDALFVTPTRTILYRADKLLSDESVEEFPHGAERITVSSGRRKATVTLDYGLDGERSFTVPAKALDEALHPVLAGTLNAAGVTESGETIKETFRFSELTLVVTSERLVKHIGNAVWDEEYEEFRYADVTNLAFEEGSVATTIVVVLGGRQERFKAPNDRAREVRERLTEAVLAHHGVDSLAALRERFADDEDEPPSSTVSFGDGPTPLSVNPGELTERPTNATRPDADEEQAQGDDTAERTVAPAAADDADPVAPDSVDPADTVPDDSPTGPAEVDSGTTRDRQTGTPETPEATTSSDTAGASPEDRSTGVDTIETGDLLGPPDDSAGRPTTDARPEGEDDGDRADDLASLAAEIEALRESVEAQNERIARQEELIERLIVELRNRL
ncbi:DUF7115 domain-containing protein [Salinigranum sp. GCM10025319]|uniref:DUF7115 domain-containing protein n=1 Tax=Salinigranum sp. GCM10025319 TaxID=3252687 RepID=UPI003615D747